MQDTSLKLPQWISHRGVHTSLPENTLAAFGLSRQQGFTCVEFDVLLTQDAVPVVIHDETVDRTTMGQGRVNTYSYAALRQLRLRNASPWIRIPTLDQTLTYLTAVGLQANIEIKTATHPHAPLDFLTKERLDLMQNQRNARLSCSILRAHPDGQYLISSFCMAALFEVRRCLPRISIGILCEFKNWESEWPQKRNVLRHYCQAFNAYSLHINDCELTRKRVAELKQICPRILVYTINDPRRAVELFNWGITSVFTDCVTA